MSSVETIQGQIMTKLLKVFVAVHMFQKTVPKTIRQFKAISVQTSCWSCARGAKVWFLSESVGSRVQDTGQLIMSQPRRSQPLAARRFEPVPIPLHSDSDSTFSIGVLCEVCGSEDLGVVHPCCNFAAHQQCLTHDAEVSCPYCGIV